VIFSGLGGWILCLVVWVGGGLSQHESLILAQNERWRQA
jgi:hypothetical protein